MSLIYSVEKWLVPKKWHDMTEMLFAGTLNLNINKLKQSAFFEIILVSVIRNRTGIVKRQTDKYHTRGIGLDRRGMITTD